MKDEMIFWVVWNPSQGLPRYRHTTIDEAKAEAERLARLSQGQKFYVLQALGVAEVEKAKIYRNLDDGIPF